ncbi:hypothetical protein SOVF_176200 [Spinacia oleracea]|nr:hypothetical protein SOVF_176200 [Spinacia oleracea]
MQQNTSAEEETASPELACNIPHTCNKQAVAAAPKEKKPGQRPQKTKPKQQLTSHAIGQNKNQGTSQNRTKT